jgi:adenylate cyclase
VFHAENPAPRDHAQRAVLCGVEMQIAMHELREQHRRDKLPEVFLGVGISTGTVMAGLIGSAVYRAYTVIGEEVNLASRIEAFSLRGQVLLSEATYAHCRDFVEVGPSMEVYVKGRRQRLRIHEALSIPGLGRTVPRQEVRKSPRIETSLPLEYRPLTGKLVASGPLRGVVRDLGYHGALIELAEALPPYSEVKLAFTLPGLDFRADDIYARLVSVRVQEGRHLAGLEFSSLSAETAAKVQLYVQMCIQGDRPEGETKTRVA